MKILHKLAAILSPSPRPREEGGQLASGVRGNPSARKPLTPALSPHAGRGGILTALLLILAPLAHAQTAASPLVLKADITDGDGRITIGDLFDNAGAYADVQLGTRSGATAVLDAAAVQAIAGRAGAYWDNPKGLHRIIVSQGADGMPSDSAVVPVSAAAPAGNQQALVFTHPMNTGDVVQPEDLQFAAVAALSAGMPSDAQAVIGKVVRYPIRQGAAVRLSDVSSPVVVHRSEQVQVTWAANGMSLSMTGVAQKDAASGDVIQVQNPVSKKLIDAVVTGPGQALAGPAADALRSRTLLSSR